MGVEQNMVAPGGATILMEGKSNGSSNDDDLLNSATSSATVREVLKAQAVTKCYGQKVFTSAEMDTLEDSMSGDNVEG